MPSKWTMDTLPTPDDDKVALVTVPGETVAVLRFSGDRGAAAVAARTEELVEVLRDKGIDDGRRTRRLVLRSAVDAAVPAPQRDRRSGGKLTRRQAVSMQD